MDYYDSFHGHQRPYGRHDDPVPDDIDGPPPPGFYNHAGPPPPPSTYPPWAPPTFGGHREYHSSPPRGDYPRGSYPHSPDRGRAHSSIEDFIPDVFPREESHPPDAYPDQHYGYGSDHHHHPYPRGGAGDYGPPEYGPRMLPPPEYGPRPYPEYGHHDFDRRPPPPGYPHSDFDRRDPRPPPDVYPPPRHGPEGLRDEPTFAAYAGRPPLPYEPQPSPRREVVPPPVTVVHAPPPPMPSPTRGIPHPVVESEGPQFPPMPYEPDVVVGDGAGGGSPAPAPPPVVVVTHEPAVVEEEALHFPPLPYEPGRSPAHHHHGDGGGGGGVLPPEVYPPELGMMGGERDVPYFAEMGVPPLGVAPPFADPLYGHTMAHRHVKRFQFESCKDYWAGFLFLLHFCAVIGVCIFLGIKGVIKTNQNNDLIRAYERAPSPAPPVPSELYNMKHWAPQLATAAASGWVFAFFWQWLVKTATMIKVCLSLGAVSTGLLGIILVSTGSAKGLVGLIFLVAALFQGLYVHLVRHRIPFAAIMLDRTRDVVRRYRGLHLISMWTVFLAMIWLAIWIFGVSGAVSLPYGGWYAALLVISLAWTMEVLRNIVYVTVAGVVARYYYEANNMPPLPVLKSYRRAWTTSFGSVCLGSMFVAPVQTLHSIAKRLANEQGENEFLFSCVNCFLGVMEFLNKHFNKWAFVQVGFRGESFVRSAKETWEMFKLQGVMLLINDDLTGAILLTSCIIGGVLTALVGGCWTFATHRYLTVGVSILSFCIGFFVTYLTLVVPESSVASYYVCFAEDRATLRKADEPFYSYMSIRLQNLDQEAE